MDNSQYIVFHPDPNKPFLVKFHKLIKSIPCKTISDTYIFKFKGVTNKVTITDPAPDPYMEEFNRGNVDYIIDEYLIEINYRTRDLTCFKVLTFNLN